MALTWGLSQSLKGSLCHQGQTDKLTEAVKAQYMKIFMCLESNMCIFGQQASHTNLTCLPTCQINIGCHSKPVHRCMTMYFMFVTFYHLLYLCASERNKFTFWRYGAL